MEGGAQQRVLILAPTRRDAEVTCRLLHNQVCHVCADAAELATELGRGAGAIVLTDDALRPPGFSVVQAALAAQEQWSDVPIVLLMRQEERHPRALAVLASLTNVTVLDRPSSTRTLRSAVQSALRSRRKQFQIRDHLALQAKSEALLREADQRKDVFLATLAHELRNPLAAVFTGIQVLERMEGAADVQAARTLSMMDRQSRTLVKLIDELMDVSRISTGKLVLQKERLDVREVIAAALETGESQVEAAGHMLQVDMPAAPVWVEADRSRLVQVVGNLIGNASKYTPAGGRVRIAVAAEAGQAVIRVADNGVGIPAEMLDTVFDMFTQINRTLDRSQGGLGIGLSLVRRLMELHGGSITAASAGVDRGSEFTVRMPLAADLPASAAASAGTGTVATPAPALRILLVDDNTDVAELLAGFLEAEGHVVRFEHGGAAAVAMAGSFAPDVVFCDVGMPGMDGHQVARALRADPRHAGALLVALTGWGSDEQKRKSREAGFDLHLTKPVTLADIERILAQVARSRPA